ncbi:MAG: tetratricopeptide repeat protein, partial [Candidatus Methylumidiphilus sp.]
RNYPKAMEIFAAARERFPDNTAIKQNYIDALLATQKAEPARRLLEDMIHGVVTPETYESLCCRGSARGRRRRFPWLWGSCADPFPPWPGR